MPASTWLPEARLPSIGSLVALPVPAEAPVGPVPLEPPVGLAGWLGAQLAEVSPRTPTALPQTVTGTDGEMSPTFTPTWLPEAIGPVSRTPIPAGASPVRSSRVSSPVGSRLSVAGSPTRVKGLDPSSPTPARLAVASRSSSRPARRVSLAEASAGPAGSCPPRRRRWPTGTSGWPRPGPRWCRAWSRARRRPGPCRAPGPLPGSPVGLAAAGLGAGAGAGAAAAADQPGQDPAVGADPDLGGGRAAEAGGDVGGDVLGAGGAGAEGQQAPAERGRAECTLHPQVHLELSLVAGSRTWSTSPEVARRERRPGGRSARGRPTGRGGRVRGR